MEATGEQAAGKARQRSVRRETSNVKGFGRRALGSPTFHLSRLTYHGFEGDLFSLLGGFTHIDRSPREMRCSSSLALPRIPFHPYPKR